MRGQARQGHALTGERGLGYLVRKVEIQPAFGLGAGEAMRIEPTPPGEPRHVGAAVRIAGFNQGKVLQVFASLQRCLAFEQPGAGHWGELFSKKTLCARWCAAGLGVAQGQVHIASIHVHRHVGGINAKVDAGCRL